MASSQERMATGESYVSYVSLEGGWRAAHIRPVGCNGLSKHIASHRHDTCLYGHLDDLSGHDKCLNLRMLKKECRRK